MKLPLHLNTLPDGPQKDMARALHVASMLSLSPKGFRDAPKNRKKNPQLTMVERVSVAAGLTTVKELFASNPIEQPERRRVAPTRTAIDRGTRRNIKFGRNTTGNTTPDQRKENLAKTQIARDERTLEAYRLAKEIDNATQL